MKKPTAIHSGELFLIDSYHYVLGFNAAKIRKNPLTTNKQMNFLF